MMKTKPINSASLVLFWTVVVCFVLLAGCKEKEVIESIDYSPVELKATSFSNLEEKSVTLNGSIIRLNGMSVQDHGFIIQQIGSTKDDGKEILVSLGSDARVGEVTLKYRHSRNFELGDRFSYTLYVQTSNGFYRSESSSFQADGMVVNLLKDSRVPDNSLVTVTGDFQFLSNAQLYYQYRNENEVRLPYTIASDKKSISFNFPHSNRFYHGNNVSVFLRVNENFNYLSKREIANIQVLGAADPPAQTKMLLSEPIQLQGTAIKWDGMPMSAPFYILINGKKIEHKYHVNLYEIEGLRGNKFQLGYHNGKDSVVFKDSIELIKPLGSAIRFGRRVVHSPSAMDIIGIGMYTYIMDPNAPNYYLGQHKIAHRFNSSYGDPQTYAVRNIPDGVYKFRYESPFYSVTSEEQVEVRNLRWDTPANTTVFVTEPFTITGNFIDGQRYSVTGNGIGEYPIAKDGKISFTLPSYVIGNTEIQIGYSVNLDYNEQFTAPKRQRLHVRNFQVSSVSPLKGFPGDIVTIKGRGLAPTQITIGGIYARTVSHSSEEITFMVPVLAPKEKSAIVLSLNGKSITYKDLFEVL